MNTALLVAVCSIVAAGIGSYASVAVGKRSSGVEREKLHAQIVKDKEAADQTWLGKFSDLMDKYEVLWKRSLDQEQKISNLEAMTLELRRDNTFAQGHIADLKMENTDLKAENADYKNREAMWLVERSALDMERNGLLSENATLKQKVAG